MASKLTIDSLGDAVARALGQRLMALLLYGSAARGTNVRDRSDINTLLICDAADDALFDALAPVVREWRESADAFPIEYEDMRDAHRLLAGRDPWQGISVRRDDVRRQLEHELLGKLVRLRQAYGALWGEPKRLAGVIVGSAPGFFTMLRAALRLAGEAAPADPAALVRAGGVRIGFAPERLAGLVAHATGGRALKLESGDPLAAAYLDAVARTAEYVNRLG